MKRAAVWTLAALFAIVAAPSSSGAGQAGRQAAARQPAAPAAQPSDPVAEAYLQFLLAQRLEDDSDVDGAIAAYKRATTLDPQAADVVSALADLYLRQDRTADATAAAEQALTIDPSNREAHRVLGTIYASMASSAQPGQGQRDSQQSQRENLTKAIQHLEQAIDNSPGLPDANLRAMLARLYVANGSYDKAIPLLAALVKEEPQWQDGAALLVEAYAAAGREADAIRWLEEAVEDDPQLYPALADFYGRERKWQEAAAAYEQALQLAPRNVDLKVRYASMLLNEGGQDNIIKARDALRDALAARRGRTTSARCTCCLKRSAGPATSTQRRARRAS
jgi:tetratricopeptide (TPR) repeat protein